MNSSIKIQCVFVAIFDMVMVMESGNVTDVNLAMVEKSVYRHCVFE